MYHHNSARWYVSRAGMNDQLDVSLVSSGARYFLEIERRDHQGNQTGTALVELEFGKSARAELHALLDEKLDRAEIEAAIDARLERFKRSSEGLFVPAGPADLVIVEKPDATAVRVLTRDDERGEEIEKRAVHVTEEACSCPLPLVARVGCARLRGESRCVSRQDWLVGLRRSGLLPTKPKGVA